MATYYKYAERAAGSQVNWAEIGKNLTDTLQEESRIREEKKAAIEEATRQYGIQLENSPQGDNTTLNQWGLDFGGDAQEARLLQDRLLRSGQLKLKDYTIMRQNLTDGTKIAFDLLDEYNAEYKVKMERAKSMDPATASQYLEQWLGEQAEGFANFKDSKLYINPSTFAVNVAKVKTKNGVQEMSTDPNDFTTVNELRNRIKARFDKFDTDGYLAKQVSLLGTDIKATIKAGTSTKVGQKITEEDIRQRDGAKEAISAIVDAGLNLPTNVSSILTNDLGLYKDPANPNDPGVAFTFTWDEKAAGKNVIYLKKVDGQITPQFTEEQKKLAKDYMLQKFNMMITRKEDIDVFTEPRPAASTSNTGTSREKYQKDMSRGNLLAYFYSGDGTQIETARQAIEALPGVDKVVRTKDGVIINFKNEDGKIEQKPFSFYDEDGNRKSIDDFVNSMSQAIYGTDVNLEAIRQGAYNIGNPNLNEEYYAEPDLEGLDPVFDAPEIFRRRNDRSTWKVKGGGAQPSGGQQGGGTGELD
jgi:hypothetical protein